MAAVSFIALERFIMAIKFLLYVKSGSKISLKKRCRYEVKVLVKFKRQKIYTYTFIKIHVNFRKCCPGEFWDTGVDFFLLLFI